MQSFASVHLSVSLFRVKAQISILSSKGVKMHGKIYNVLSGYLEGLNLGQK